MVEELTLAPRRLPPSPAPQQCFMQGLLPLTQIVAAAALAQPVGPDQRLKTAGVESPPVAQNGWLEIRYGGSTTGAYWAHQTGPNAAFLRAQRLSFSSSYIKQTVRQLHHELKPRISDLACTTLRALFRSIATLAVGFPTPPQRPPSHWPGRQAEREHTAFFDQLTHIHTNKGWNQQDHEKEPGLRANMSFR